MEPLECAVAVRSEGSLVEDSLSSNLGQLANSVAPKLFAAFNSSTADRLFLYEACGREEIDGESSGHVLLQFGSLRAKRKTSSSDKICKNTG